MFGKVVVKISDILVVQTFAGFEPNLKIAGVVVFPGQTLRKLLLQRLSTVGITIDGQTRGPNTWLIAKPNLQSFTRFRQPYVKNSTHHIMIAKATQMAKRNGTI